MPRRSLVSTRARSSNPPAGSASDPVCAGRLAAALLFVALVVAVIGSLGAPLLTAVAREYRVCLAAAQWTVTIPLASGAIATPLLGRMGSEFRRRSVVLGTLAVVVAGSAATVLPAPFFVLLVGRAAQGVGIGLPALMMATARQYLGQRAHKTITMLSVASTVGVGLGYPIAGWLSQVAGVRAAYLLGLVIAGAAIVVAVVALPGDSASTLHDESMDWVGGVLLSFGLLAVLVSVSEIGLWSTLPLLAAAILATGVGVLGVWVAVEQEVRRPLVDLQAIRHPAVLGANLIMAIAGVAMYLLFTLITRFLQTPSQVGYGYGLTDVQAGLALVPFSVLSFIAGRLVARMQRSSPLLPLAASGVALVVAGGLFATTRSLSVVWPTVAMGVLGLSVGGFSAAMPRLILAVTPCAETAAAMSVNQVVRAVGFSVGSAVGACVLAAYTAGGHVSPSELGYTVTAWTGAALACATIVLVAALHAKTRRSR